MMGISIGYVLPTNPAPAKATYQSATTETNLSQLDDSLGELQMLVAKLQPRASRQPLFEKVLRQCECNDCACDSPSKNPPPVAEVAKTLESTPATTQTANEIGYKPGLVASSTTPANYTPRWTHPSTIEDHMVSTHGVSTTGKTRAQLYAEHDAIHDSERSQSRQTLGYSSVVRSSSCPGGVCPVPQRSYQTVRPFRLFRR